MHLPKNESFKDALNCLFILFKSFLVFAFVLPCNDCCCKFSPPLEIMHSDFVVQLLQCSLGKKNKIVIQLLLALLLAISFFNDRCDRLLEIF